MAATLPTDASTRALLRRLWREHLLGQRLRIVAALACTAALAGITALYPIIIQQAFDRFSRNDPDVITALPPLILAITAARGAAMYGQQLAVQSAVLRVIEGLQQRLFAALTRADLATVLAEAPARHASRFTTEAAAIREALTRAVAGVSNVLTIAGLVGSMLWLDPGLALLAAALYPLAALPIIALGRRIRRASAGMQDRVGETSAALTESFAAAVAVRSYRLEDAEERRAAGAFDALRRSLYRIARTRARVDPVLEALGGVAVAAVLAVVGWRVAEGHGTVGQFTGFAAALLIAAQPVRQLGSLNAALQQGLAGLNAVFRVIDTPRGVAEAPHARPLPPGSGRVVFEGVRFTWPGRNVPALDGFDLVAEPGQTVALVGASGAGKSTALALVPRLFDPQAGRVLLDGADLRDVTLASLRDAIAHVGQDAVLFDLPVADNIALGRPGATQARIEAAARAAQAHDFVLALPQGYATPVGPGGGRLSGGQRQRVALARALLRDPRVLLLDEATSALDAENEAAVAAALATLRRGRTTLVVAHRLATVRDADRILVLNEGRVVEAGTHAALLAAGGPYARLVRTQAFAAMAPEPVR